MTLSTAQGVYVLAALAVGSGLWAAHISVNSAIRGQEWALSRLPAQVRVGLVAVALGVILGALVEPFWVGIGIAYLAGVVAWTARAVHRGISRLSEEGLANRLPADRQAAVVRKVSNWLLLVALLGVAVVVVDFEERGAVALWDLALVAVVAGVGVAYWKRAGALDSESREPA